MTKYLKSEPFSSRPMTKEYAEGWDRIFGKKPPQISEHQLDVLRAVADNTCFVQISGTLMGLADLDLIEMVDPCPEHDCGWKLTDLGRKALNVDNGSG